MTNCKELRCPWEKDRAMTGRMLAVAKIHRDIIYHTDEYENLSLYIKEGDNVNSDIVRFGPNPFFRIDSRYKTRENVRDHILEFKQLNVRFYQMAQILAEETAHIGEVEWCVYSAREKLDPDDTTMIIPSFFSTTTSFPLVENWRKKSRDIFKIFLRGVKLAVMETISEPLYTGDDKENCEHEITVPPGTLHIVRKELCTDIDRYIYTCEFTPMPILEWITRVDAMTIYTETPVDGYDLIPDYATVQMDDEDDTYIAFPLSRQDQEDHDKRIAYLNAKYGEYDDTLLGQDEDTLYDQYDDEDRI